jgi:hypothetical protein
MSTADRFIHHGRTVKLITVDNDNGGISKQYLDDICKATDESIAEFIANACNLYNPAKRQKKRK